MKHFESFSIPPIDLLERRFIIFHAKINASFSILTYVEIKYYKTPSITHFAWWFFSQSDDWSQHLTDPLANRYIIGFLWGRSIANRFKFSSVADTAYNQANFSANARTHFRVQNVAECTPTAANWRDGLAKGTQHIFHPKDACFSSLAINFFRANILTWNSFIIRSHSSRRLGWQSYVPNDTRGLATCIWKMWRGRRHLHSAG